MRTKCEVCFINWMYNGDHREYFDTFIEEAYTKIFKENEEFINRQKEQWGLQEKRKTSQNQPNTEIRTIQQSHTSTQTDNESQSTIITHHDNTQ